MTFPPSGKQLLILTPALLLLVALVVITQDKVSEKRSISNNLRTLPVLHLTTTDGQLFSFPKQRAIVLVIFDPTCEHCQREAQDVEEHIGSFSESTMVWISTASPTEIKQFCSNHLLATRKNIHFTNIHNDELQRSFGSAIVPYILIYNKEGRLLQEFKGETKAEAILKWLE